MAFGIPEEHKLPCVPGTPQLLVDVNQQTKDEGGELKRDTGKSHVALISSRPSGDPCHPLNWPRWKKEACFWTLVFTTSVTSSLLPLANAAYVPLAKDFHVPVDNVASSFDVSVPAVGVFLLVQNTLAVKYGHRIVYLLSTLLMFMSCIWTALSPDLVSIRASRVFQGFGEAAPECLVAVTLAHLYPVHERGSRLGIWNRSRLAGTILGPFIGSYVTQNLSWQLGFWFASIACGLSFIGVFFFVPETTYHRQSSPSHCKTSAVSSDVENPNLDGDSTPSSILPSSPSRLKIYNGTFSDESVWKISLRPFPFLLSPVTWFMFATFSMPMVWLNLVSLCSSTIFTVTYGFNAAQTGLANLGGIIGIVLAMIIISPLSDWWITWMAQRNRGVYEPEYRLVFMLCMLFGVFGFVGWAIGNKHHMPWVGAVACLTMLCFSLVVAAGTTLAYLLDTHGVNALHILAITGFAQNMVRYSTTFFADSLVRAAGVERSLFVLGACQAGCWLASIPMYVYGKRVRSFIARHPRLFRGDLPASDSLQFAAPAPTGTLRVEVSIESPGSPSLRDES